MAEVTGSITSADGVKDVVLNNAATEATLRQLLASSMSANKQTLDKLSEWAKTAGLSKEGFDSTNQTLKNTGNASNQLNQSFAGLNLAATSVQTAFSGLYSIATKLTSGTGSLAEVFGSMSRLPLGIGVVASGLAAMASQQEAMLKSYRTMSDGGANFNGSLTDMRLAAGRTYLTLEQFANVMKTNSATLAKMGTSVTDGAKAFATMSNGLISSDAGNKLMALGYSTEDLNNGLLNFIGTTGNAANSQKDNSQALVTATASYLTELDAITQFTGVSRKKLEEDQKKAAEQQAFQRKLASMAPADAAKVKAAYDAASASGIKGATDLVMSTALGLPPMTEAARMLSGVLPDAAAGIVNMTNTAMDHNSSMADVNDGLTGMLLGAKKNTAEMAQTGDALTMMPGVLGEVVNSGMAAENLIKAKGIETAEDGRKAFKDIFDKQAAQAKGSASNAAQTQKKVQETGSKLLEYGEFFMKMMSPTLLYLSYLGKAIVDNTALFVGLSLALGGILGTIAFMKGKETVGKLAAGYKGGGIKGALSNLVLSRDGSTPDRALYVTLVGGAAGGFDLPDRNKKGPPTTKSGRVLSETAGSNRAARLAAVAEGRAAQAAATTAAQAAATSPSMLGKMAGMAGKMAGKLSIGGILGGVALDAGSKYATDSGYKKTGAGLDTASSALSGAGMGAMLGSLAGPLGTIIGGAVGGIAGGAYGLYNNFSTLTGDSEDKKTTTDTAQSTPGTIDRQTLETNQKILENLEAQRLTQEKQLAQTIANGGADGKSKWSWLTGG
jgi:hypothetical protein